MSNETNSTPPRSPRLVAWTFVAAFAASVVTVIYTGLLVQAPRTEISAALPVVEMAVNENRTVNLVFTAAAPMADASLSVELPPGIELLGYPGQSQIRWSTQLDAGKNILPVTLTARGPVTGQIVARLRQGAQQKVFRVHVDARAQ